MLTSLKFCFRQETHSPHDINGLKNKAFTNLATKGITRTRPAHSLHCCCLGKTKFATKIFHSTNFSLFWPFSFVRGSNFFCDSPGVARFHWVNRTSQPHNGAHPKNAHTGTDTPRHTQQNAQKGTVDSRSKLLRGLPV
jgi:hypothetical protein